MEYLHSLKAKMRAFQRTMVIGKKCKENDQATDKRIKQPLKNLLTFEKVATALDLGNWLSVICTIHILLESPFPAVPSYQTHFHI